MTAERGNEGKEGKRENECVRGRETLPSSGNTPTIVCVCVCACARLSVCVRVVSQPNRHTHRL